MNHSSPKYRWLFSLLSIEGALCALAFLLLPGGTASAWLFGLSKARLGLLASLLLPALVSGTLAIGLWRRPELERAVNRFADHALSRPWIQWLLVDLASAGAVMGGGLLILQWVITDRQALGILQILTPLLVFFTIACAQLLGVLVSNVDRDRRAQLLAPMAFMVLFSLAQWLSIPEKHRLGMLPYAPAYLVLTAVSAHLSLVLLTHVKRNNMAWVLILFTLAFFVFNWFLLPPAYRQRTAPLIPIFLLLSLVFARGCDLLAFQLRGHRVARPLLLVFYGILAVIFIALYYTTATEHAQTVNTDPEPSDQSAYLRFIQQVRATNYRFTGDRNRMPLYPFLQALFHDPSQAWLEFFNRSKQVNILLSIALVLVLLVVFRRFLPSHPSVNLALITAFSLFIFKAGYVQAELLYFFLIFLSFLTLALMLVNPTPQLGVLCGCLVGLTHLTKASVLPLFILFAVLFILKEFFHLYKKHKEKSANDENPGGRQRHILALLAVALAYLLVIFPYIQESKIVYGSYFFNVNTRFYMWYDSWEQAKAGIRQDYNNLEWRNVSPELLPGPVNYLREHDLADILQRLNTGFKSQIFYLSTPYGLFNYLIGWLLILVGVASAQRRELPILARKYAFVIVFTFLYFLGYITLYAWYSPIAGGPRFILSLFLPMIFSASAAGYALSAARNGLKQGFKPELAGSLYAAGNWAITALLAIDVYFILTEILKNGYFGS